MAEETILAWCSHLCFSVLYRHRMCLMGSLILVKVFSEVWYSVLNWCLPLEGRWDARQQNPSSSQGAWDLVVVWLYWRPQRTQRALKVVFCTPALQPLLTASMVAARSVAVLAVQHGQEDYVCVHLWVYKAACPGVQPQPHRGCCGSCLPISIFFAWTQGFGKGKGGAGVPAGLALLWNQKLVPHLELETQKLFKTWQQRCSLGCGSGRKVEILY